MPCEVTSEGNVLVFSCTRSSSIARCETPGCVEPHVVVCGFELGERKAGQMCGKKLCVLCRRLRDGAPLCVPHDALVSARAEQRRR